MTSFIKPQTYRLLFGPPGPDCDPPAFPHINIFSPAPQGLVAAIRSLQESCHYGSTELDATMYRFIKLPNGDTKLRFPIFVPPVLEENCLSMVNILRAGKFKSADTVDCTRSEVRGWKIATIVDTSLDALTAKIIRMTETLETERREALYPFYVAISGLEPFA